jgi:protein transport protein SEC24
LYLTVEPDYFSVLDANFTRLDYSERSELQKGTVNFDVSQSADYWASQPSQHWGLSSPLSDSLEDVARRPQNMRYVFVLDVSDTSVRSGFLAAACVALRAVLHGRFAEDGSEATHPCLPSGCSIALVTFDDTLHFYNLSVRTHSWLDGALRPTVRCSPIKPYQRSWLFQMLTSRSFHYHILLCS